MVPPTTATYHLDIMEIYFSVVFNTFLFAFPEYQTKVLFSPQSRGVAGDEHQFGLALTQGLQSLLVTQAVFTGFHHQRQTRIGALQSLFLQNHKKVNTKLG